MLKKIQQLCREQKKTIRDLEQKCGIGSRSIYHWDESMPSVDKVKRVADYLGVTVDELISEKGGEAE